MIGAGCENLFTLTGGLIPLEDRVARGHEAILQDLHV